MNNNYCKLCNQKIPTDSYSNKVYCSGKCRFYACQVRKGSLTLSHAESLVKDVTNSMVLGKSGDKNGRTTTEGQLLQKDSIRN